MSRAGGSWLIESQPRALCLPDIEGLTADAGFSPAYLHGNTDLLAWRNAVFDPAVRPLVPCPIGQIDSAFGGDVA